MIRRRPDAREQTSLQTAAARRPQEETRTADSQRLKMCARPVPAQSANDECPHYAPMLAANDEHAACEPQRTEDHELIGRQHKRGPRKAVEVPSNDQPGRSNSDRHNRAEAKEISADESRESWLPDCDG